MALAADLPMLASIKQAAEVLGLSEGMTRGLIDGGRIAHVQVGKSKRMIPRDAIERFVNDNTVKPCRDATTAPAFASSTSAAVSTSSGLTEDAAGSAAHTRLIAERLKLRSRSSSDNSHQTSARVIPLRSS